MSSEQAKTNLAELQTRLEDVYSTLAVYGSVPPAKRQRAEGIASAALVCEQIDADSLASIIEDVHRRMVGEEFQVRQGRSAISCIDPKSHDVRLAVTMRRAPVWPSTSD